MTAAPQLTTTSPSNMGSVLHDAATRPRTFTRCAIIAALGAAVGVPCAGAQARYAPQERTAAAGATVAYMGIVNSVSPLSLVSMPPRGNANVTSTVTSTGNARFRLMVTLKPGYANAVYAQNPATGQYYKTALAVGVPTLVATGVGGPNVKSNVYYQIVWAKSGNHDMSEAAALNSYLTYTVTSTP